MKLRWLTWIVLLAAFLAACNTLDPETSLDPQLAIPDPGNYHTVVVVNKGGNSTWKGWGEFRNWTPKGSGNAEATAYSGKTIVIGAYGQGGVWEGCDETSHSGPKKHYCTVKVTKDRKVTFKVEVTLWVSVSGLSVSGPGIDCEPFGGELRDCTEKFIKGAEVNLFSSTSNTSWAHGCTTSQGNRCTVIMDADHGVVAHPSP